MSTDNLARNILPKQARVFTPWNVFSALLLLSERQSIMVKRVLQDFGMNVHSASSISEVEQIVRSTRLDLAICDFEVPRAGELALLQPSTRWRGVCVGLMPAGCLDDSNHKRIQLWVPKPVSVDMLVRSLKASYTSMAQQRIATYRHTLPVKLVSGTLNHRGWRRTLHQASILNVSQTGLCLNTTEPLPHGASVNMSLVLPEPPASIHATGKIVWSHSSGRAGVAFDRATCPEMKKLQDRLNTLLPRELELMARFN
ncbi:MAG TPA: PilZ domain-containing protein [Candidatus Angelobacter sp.]|jgi:CheY-like chemotaxis protein/Tfp pilus assembly protein PilZ